MVLKGNNAEEESVPLATELEQIVRERMVWSVSIIVCTYKPLIPVDIIVIAKVFILACLETLTLIGDECFDFYFYFQFNDDRFLVYRNSMSSWSGWES